VFKVVGSNKRFPVVKDSYVTDENDMAKRSVLDGDSFLPGATASWRFRSPEVEPYMSSQGKGLPWFSVSKVGAFGLGGGGGVHWWGLGLCGCIDVWVLVEPYMSSQGKGLPWFSVNKVRALLGCLGGLVGCG
jgi:hypothetical protein